MSKIKYIDKCVRANTIELIELSNNIIEDFQARGYELTLRQLYYQLVGRDLIPNTDKSYKVLGTAISTGRLIGLVDWDAIVDRTRVRSRQPSWNSPAEILDVAARQYRVDLWQGQEYRVFVWVEKEALSGVIARACEADAIQADYIACRGYMSQSTIWREAQNLIKVWENDQIPVILHLGDHDPSGIDMTRDNIKRLSLFSELEEGIDFIVERIALNIHQVNARNLPPNPTKLSDSRASGYITQYGRSSWELDALDPDVLVELIRNHARNYIDPQVWAKRRQLQDEQRQALKKIAEQFNNHPLNEETA